MEKLGTSPKKHAFGVVHKNWYVLTERRKSEEEVSSAVINMSTASKCLPHTGYNWRVCVCVFTSRTELVNARLLIGLISFRLHCLFSSCWCWVLTIFSFILVFSALSLRILCEFYLQPFYEFYANGTICFVYGKPCKGWANFGWRKQKALQSMDDNNKWYRFKLKPNDFATAVSANSTVWVRKYFPFQNIVNLWLFSINSKYIHNICWIDALLSDYT